VERRLEEELEALRGEREELMARAESADSQIATLKGRIAALEQAITAIRNPPPPTPLRPSTPGNGSSGASTGPDAHTNGGPAMHLADRPVAVEVKHLHKSFRMPSHRVDTFKERILKHPFGIEYRQLEVLRDVSFSIGQGEFVGIVGVNGAGKSTLLKLLTGTYRADAGSIRVAGRIAPLIELGVGFIPDLTAWDNIVVNAVLLGMTPKEAAERFEEILEFAGLEDFTELPLRNYSSGMLVRLGFAVTAMVESDIMLVDEVLAVGDADFQERCMEVLARRRQQGTTICLVSHSMARVRQGCERAILLDGGTITADGHPDEVAVAYSDASKAVGRVGLGLAADGRS
jgi:ABC-2 type transport system ATP-binding protein